MGKAPLVALAVIWIAWFFLPAVSLSTPFFQKSLTFWEVLGVNFNNGTNLMSHGFFSLLGLVAIAAPLTVPHLRKTRC